MARARDDVGETDTGPAASIQSPLSDLPVVPELVAAFGDPVPPEEIVLWNAMTSDGRARAVARLGAVRTWDADATAGSADVIARGLGISRSRFYRMVSDWRSRPSLASLGAKTGVAKARAPRANLAAAYEALESQLPFVVTEVLGRGAMDDGGISGMVRLLRSRVEPHVERMPGDTTLRAMVEKELRRRDLLAMAGAEVIFDLCAIGVPDGDGRPHVMFACVDRATTIVFGVGIGALDASRAGHAAAARDALARLGASSSGLPWAPALDRAQITPGTDAVAWDGFFADAGRDVGANVQLKGGGARFGTDLRRLLGDSLGRVRLLPLKPGPLTPLTISVAEGAFGPVEARARLEAGVVEHNAYIMEAIGASAGTPPPGLIALLRLMAG